MDPAQAGPAIDAAFAPLSLRINHFAAETALTPSPGPRDVAGPQLFYELPAQSTAIACAWQTVVNYAPSVLRMHPAGPISTAMTRLLESFVISLGS